MLVAEVVEEPPDKPRSKANNESDEYGDVNHTNTVPISVTFEQQLAETDYCDNRRHDYKSQDCYRY
jgi:hypothetical protein